MEDFILSTLEFFGKAWWVEIKTESPRCTYYFGPFVRKQEAREHQSGYVEDLEGEGAVISSLEIKRCKPRVLTDYDENETEGKEEDFSRISYDRPKSFHE